MTIDPHKYIVFKREDLFQLMGELALPPYVQRPDKPYREGQGEIEGAQWDCAPIAEHIKQRVEATELPGCTVLRDQDVFTADALHTYAGQIQTVVSTIRKMYPKEPVNGQYVHLLELRDFFAQRADEADAVPDDERKIPD